MLVGASTGAAYWFDRALDRPGPLPEGKAFVVPRGGSAQLAQALSDSGIIDRQWLFRAAVLSTSGTLHAAEFAFPARASVRQVLAILRSARPVEHRVTIAEGLTAQQIAAVIAHAEAAAGTVPHLEEGSVLPQTYAYEYGAERSALVARATAAMDKERETDWAGRDPGLPLASAREAVILASIVERETAKPEERAHVAAVYLNRLRLGMRLEADPTVAYLIGGGTGVLDHPLTKSELRRDDPFNTYRYAGLPPGPICSPGRESLRAVVHPANSDDLYFVADGSGGHTFSRTYAAHDAAVTRWRALRSGAE